MIFQVPSNLSQNDSLIPKTASQRAAPRVGPRNTPSCTGLPRILESHLPADPPQTPEFQTCETPQGTSRASGPRRCGRLPRLPPAPVPGALRALRRLLAAAPARPRPRPAASLLLAAAGFLSPGFRAAPSHPPPERDGAACGRAREGGREGEREAARMLPGSPRRQRRMLGGRRQRRSSARSRSPAMGGRA